MTVIDYLKLIDRKELFKLFFSVFLAFMGTCAVFTTFKFDYWNLKSFECLVKANPVRSGREGLVVTVSPPDGQVNVGDIKLYFSGAYDRSHPLNGLCPKDKVYVEALFHPAKGFLRRGLGIHLERDGKTLYSRDRFYKERPITKAGLVALALAAYCFLLYKINKHYYHYRHMNGKRRYNEKKRHRESI